MRSTSFLLSLLCLFVSIALFAAHLQNSNDVTTTTTMNRQLDEGTSPVASPSDIDGVFNETSVTPMPTTVTPLPLGGDDGKQQEEETTTSPPAPTDIGNDFEQQTPVPEPANEDDIPKDTPVNAPTDSNTETEVPGGDEITPSPTPVGDEGGSRPSTPTSTTENVESPEAAPTEGGGFEPEMTPEPAPTGGETPMKTPAPTLPYVPQPTYDYTTPPFASFPSPTPVPYIPDDDFDPIENGDGGEGTSTFTDDEKWAWDNSTVEQIEHDQTAIIALSVVFGVMFLFSIIVAHQMLDNPHGCCARYVVFVFVVVF
jgi:hypothetical protein